MSTIFSEPTKINIICCFLFSLEQWWEWWNGSPLNKFLKNHWFSKLLLKNLAADCWSVIPPFFNCDWHFWSPWNCFPFSAPCANTDFHALENSAATNFEPRLHNSATCICQCSRLLSNFQPEPKPKCFCKTTDNLSLTLAVLWIFTTFET